MVLYLLRHAEAENIAASDFQRRLTPKGEKQAARLGRFCNREGIIPEVILSSPVLRARQTAEGVASFLSEVPCHEAPWAACGMSPEQALGELGAYAKFSSILLVGHQPDLGFLAAALLGLPRSYALRVRKGLLMGIESEPTFRLGAGELQFFIPVNFLGS